MYVERNSGLIVVLALGALVSGCSQKKGSDQPSPEVMSEAGKIFSTRCVPCHGAQGAGDGPASAGLVPKPRALNDKAWQDSATDDYIERIIQYGGAAVGKSPAMPPNPDLVDKPVVKGLRAIVRGLATR